MKTFIAYFSRADENYFGGSVRYIKVGITEVVVGKIKELIDAGVFKIEMKKPYSPVYMICIEEAKADLRRTARDTEIINVKQKGEPSITGSSADGRGFFILTWFLLL